LSYLREELPGAELRVADSTSAAVREVSRAEPGLAALGPAAAAGIYGCTVLRESIEENGVDLHGEAPAYKPGALKKDDGDKSKGAWKRIWGGGQGVGTIHAVEPVAQIVDRLEAEYREGIAALVGNDGGTTT
jgi:nitronate monooxygenase